MQQQLVLVLIKIPICYSVRCYYYQLLLLLLFSHISHLVITFSHFSYIFNMNLPSIYQPYVCNDYHDLLQNEY